MSEVDRLHWPVYNADHGTMIPAVNMNIKTDDTSLMGITE